jgi:NDP-sugar pyrophosphorylase family protein
VRVKLKGLIPAAGKGVRARPYTHEIHKGMLEINGTPNLERIITLMRDAMGITEITLVLGHLGDTIREHFGDGSALNVSLHYVQNDKLEKGLAYSVLLGLEQVLDPCCVMLCDECYIRSNHAQLAAQADPDFLATCACMHVDDDALIKRNYAVYAQGNRITRLVEKPKHIDNDVMGSGTFLLSPKLLPLLRAAFEKSESGYVEFVSFLGDLCDTRQGIGYFELTGTYVNINDRDSLQLAKYHERNQDFAGRSVDLIVYSEGDEENIAFTLSRYREVGAIDHIHVVVPRQNSIEKFITDTAVNIIRCPPGCTLYGEKLKFAMQHVKGDILILTEADYSFSSGDVDKLLAYLREADMVIGTRTTRQLIEQGSTMRGLVRLANTWLGKLLEFAWWNREGRFTDVGCTFRAIWRPNFERIQERLTTRGPEFSAEMAIELLHDRQRVIEIPVNYFNRSASQARAYQHPGTALRFLALICARRIRYLGA